jgi:hypothetical protein
MALDRPARLAARDQLLWNIRLRLLRFSGERANFVELGLAWPSLNGHPPRGAHLKGSIRHARDG